MMTPYIFGNPSVIQPLRVYRTLASDFENDYNKFSPVSPDINTSVAFAYFMLSHQDSQHF